MWLHELPLGGFIFTVFLLRRVLAFGVAIGRRPEKKRPKINSFVCLFFFPGKRLTSIFNGPLILLARTAGLFLKLASDNKLMLS